MINSQKSEINEHQFSGAYCFKWGEQWCHADSSGALYIEDLDILVVSDLHLEKASSLSRRGHFLPPYDSAKSLKKFQATVDLFQPKTIISLGDAFHDNDGRSRLSPDDANLINQIEEKHEFFWVVGNHDWAEIQNGVQNATIELHRGGYHFVHETQVNEVLPNGFEISGHYHPCATIVQRGRRLRRRCFIFDENRMIMPAFGSLTGNLNISEPIFSPFFIQSETKVILLGERSAHIFPFSACIQAR